MEFEAAKKALITALAGKKSFAIGYHPDADGIAGTALLIKYLKKQGAAREEIDLYPINNLHRSFSETHLNQIMAAKYDAIIYIDCAISDNEQISRVAAHFKPVICIDHHHYQRGLEAIPHLYINSVDFAGMTKPDLFTTSKLMHAMFYDPSDDWLELLGLEGDVVIQSIKGSPIYEAAQRLNMLGLVEEYGVSIKGVTERRNGLVALLLDTKDASDLLHRLVMDKQLESLYGDIIGDIEANLNHLRQAKPKLVFKDNKIFTHKISTVKGFDIAEHILKSHIRYLGYNETFVIYSISPSPLMGEGFTLRIYTSNPKIDCERIVRSFGGGGHQRRAGITNVKLPSPLVGEGQGEGVKGIITGIVDEIKTMAKTNHP